MGMNKAAIAALTMVVGLTACASTGETGGVKSASTTPSDSGSSDVPFPSTYKPYPGVATAIRNVTVFDGEGNRFDNGVVVFYDGKVQQIGGPDTPIPADITVFDGQGKFVTPGVIDIHSHLGVYPTPSVQAHSDGNEATSPTTPDMWAEHSVWPQDPGFSRALMNGGVTTLQILPGSANLVGGRSVTLRNVPSITVQGMKFPEAPYGMKMACGENPKRVYGSKGRSPATRMGNFAVNRQTWIKAAEYQKKRKEGKPFTRDLAMETMADVLDGKILIHNHCYRADEMAQVMDMADEFGYKVSTFHHAVEAYKIGDMLRERGICSAIWADWWGFKMEAYDAIPENAPILASNGACVVIHSDDENQIQRLNQEAAKAQADGRRMGIDIDDATVISWFTLNAAKAMGIGDQTGSLVAGKRADVVLWNGNPLSVYSRPEKVWIDGAMMYDADNLQMRPVSDFELGQPGEGDVK